MKVNDTKLYYYESGTTTSFQSRHWLRKKPFTMKLTKNTIFVLLLLLSFELCSGTTAKCDSAEREALFAVKKSLTDPSGRLFSWAGEDCCGWEGIECDNRSGHVSKVDLRNPFKLANDDDEFSDPTEAYKKSCLGGSLSPSLLSLKELSYLDLSMNNFDGNSIPGFIGGLANLRYLNLSFSSFSGVVPISLGKLVRLQVLDLFADSYLGISSGELRAESLDWLSGLSSSLIHLNLGHVKLQKVGEAWLEKVNLLPLLVELNLNWCELQGLPSSVPAIKFTSLRVLDLSENSFNSEIPLWLFSLTKLRVLHLTWNFFHGLIPKEITNLKLLEDLDLSSNLSLDGPMPRFLGSLAMLKRLALSGNGFTGGIDEFLDGIAGGSTSKLETLILFSNSLSGSLPESLGRLKNLQRLSLSGNSFSGSLPSSIGDLSSLKFLDVSDNSMNGTIPESFGQLSELVDANLVMNSWEGPLTESQLMNLKSLKTLRITTELTSLLVLTAPDKWVPPFRLDQIQLENIKLGPSFPMWLQVQTKLTSATLKNVGISGRIPEKWIPSLSSRIRHLDLSKNQIKGKLPSGLAFPKLSSIDLSSNRFNGAFPLWKTNASELFLEDNALSGPIPDDLARLMPRLQKLYLARNRLSGKIPSALCDLESVNIISLRGNKLSGAIPSCWKNKYTLWGFDFSDNNLSGSIPSAMSSLRTLAVLMLSNNNLSEEIPSSLQSCSGLTTLDLSRNKLTGSIPRWIKGGSLASLFRLKLNSNELSGHIPSELCSLSNLHSLDLSGNHLSGAIPECLNNLSALASTRSGSTFLGQLYVVLRGREPEYSNMVAEAESINLSGNNLAGKIPEQITALSALSRLDLSRNQIGGEIPSKIRNMSLETLDLSHNKLSGSIPASLSGMALLKHLNLSYNGLRGKIPALPRFNDASIFEGNPLLCGAPLATKCKTV